MSNFYFLLYAFWYLKYFSRMSTKYFHNRKKILLLICLKNSKLANIAISIVSKSPFFFELKKFLLLLVLFFAVQFLYSNFALNTVCGCSPCAHSAVFNSLWPHRLGPSGSSVHGILLAKILEWVAISSSRKSSPSNPCLLSPVSCTGKKIL